jgi:hypothetical protein
MQDIQQYVRDTATAAKQAFYLMATTLELKPSVE